MIIAGTGHRPDKLGGYNIERHERLIALAQNAIMKFRPTEVISGMALGWDQALAQAAIDLKIPLVAAVPFLDQEKCWPEESQQRYYGLLEKASKVMVVTKDIHWSRAYQLRNMWMVDHAGLILALWNGSPGGTANCVRYAQQQKRTIINLWSSWIKYK